MAEWDVRPPIFVTKARTYFLFNCAVSLLLGMGLDEFSMSATSILKTRSLLTKLDSQEMKALADKAINECTTVDEVEALVAEAVAKATGQA